MEQGQVNYEEVKELYFCGWVILAEAIDGKPLGRWTF